MATTQPLPSKTSTRLLTVNPGSGSEVVSASLSVIDLDQPHQPYEAISYTWGAPQAEHTIIVDDNPVQVRTNLHQALLRLRSPTEPRTLWCDYLCITQTDLAEKAQQVQMIGRIFGSATHVLVWLGEHADDSEELFQEWHQPRPSPSEGFVKDWKRRLKPDRAVKDAHQAAEDRRAWIWVKFFQRAYFRRTWIIQELRLARGIFVHVGPDMLSWQKLITARFTDMGMHGNFDNIMKESYLDHTSFDEPRWLLSASLSWISKFVPVPMKPMQKAPGHVIMDDWEKGPNDIFDIVGRFRDTFCHDPRDKVYAVHTLERRNDATEKPIPVSYDISLPDLVLMLFAERYVYAREPSQRLSGGVKTTLSSIGLKNTAAIERVLDLQPVPDATGLVDSLGLGRADCELAARIAHERSRNEGGTCAWRWQRVAKAIMKAFEAAVKEREFNELMLQGKAMVTHPPPSVDEKLFWLGRQKYFVE